MSFSISPAVTVSEIDLNTVVPSVSTTEGAIAGVFRWGPVYQRVLVDSETTLVSRFAEPTNFNAETFFTAANFLAYGNQLYVVRTANTTDPINGAFSAVANTAAVSGANSSLQTDTIQEQAVLNLDDLAATTFDPNVLYVAKYPGSLGNSLRVSVCDSSNAYNSTLNLIESDVSNDVSLSNITYNLGSNAGLITLTSTISGSANAAATDVLSGIGVGDYIRSATPQSVPSTFRFLARRFLPNLRMLAHTLQLPHCRSRILIRCRLAHLRRRSIVFGNSSTLLTRPLAHRSMLLPLA